MASSGTAVAWAGELAVIAYRDWKGSKRFPYPSEVLATFVVFGLLTLLPDSTDPLGPLLGAGIVLATLLNAFDPTSIGTTAASPASTTTRTSGQISQATATTLGGAQ